MTKYSITKIIGISGVSGSGKTTLSKALATQLPAIYIGWDDYDDISTAPDDYIDWYKRGQDYTEWNYSALANALQCFKTNQTILNSENPHETDRGKLVIFDSPLGRMHHQTGQYIDTCIHIETPFDISLARRLIRDYKNTQQSNDTLLDELKVYLFEARPLFFDNHLKNPADLILDGTLSTELQVQLVQRFLNNIR